MSNYSTLILASSPLVYYRLGESSGTAAVDSSGNSVGGTYAGGFTLSQNGAIVDDPNTAVLFDGTTGVVSFSPATLPSGAAARTIELWFKTGNASATMVLIGYGDPTISKGFGCYLSAGKISFWGYGNDSQYVPYTTGVYHHLAISYDGTFVRAYYDGALVGGPTAKTLNTTLTRAGIAADLITSTSPGSPFPGTLDEVAVYGTALTSTVILSHYRAGILGGPVSAYSTAVLADAPVAYYRLGESGTVTPTVTVAADSSGNGNDGLYDSDDTTLGIPGAIFGDANTAISVGGDSSGDVVDVTALAAYADSRTTLSLEMWVKMATPQTGGGGGLVMLGWDSTAFFTIDTDGSGNFGAQASLAGGAQTAATALTLSNSAWHHVVITLSATTLIIYVDGAAITTTTFASDHLTTGSGNLILSEGDLYVGSLDEVAIYPQTLSSDRVLAHYQAAQAPPASTTANASRNFFAMTSEE